MKKHMFSLVLIGVLMLVGIAGAAMAQPSALPVAQDAQPTIPPPTATPLPDPPPNCPEYQGQPTANRVGYYMGQGLAYLGNNQLDAARVSFACIARVIDPSYVPAWMGRARVYIRLADYDRAFMDLNTVIQLDSNLTAAYNDRGYVFMQYHDYDRARADFQRALDIDPTYTPAYSNLAVLYTLRGDYDQAIALLEEKIDTTQIDNILAQYRDPNRDRTLPILFEADHARLYALLGIVYERQALTQFENYTELYSNAGSYVDDRIGSAAGALQSRFTFELRLDDGSWMLLSDFPADSGI
ncbi:MAG: tetratricopeptide repeat protein [Anaerolineae bacterium]